MYKLISLIIALHLTFMANAQYQKILHQSFEIPDSVQQLQLTITGNLEVESWLGSAMLIETHVALDNGNSTLFDFLNKQGRYQIEEVFQDSTQIIKSKFEERLPIGLKSGSTLESVTVKILLPDIFVAADSTMWRRKEQ